MASLFLSPSLGSSIILNCKWLAASCHFQVQVWSQYGAVIKADLSHLSDTLQREDMASEKSRNFSFKELHVPKVSAVQRLRNNTQRLGKLHKLLTQIIRWAPWEEPGIYIALYLWFSPERQSKRPSYVNGQSLAPISRHQRASWHPYACRMPGTHLHQISFPCKNHRPGSSTLFIIHRKL